MRSIILGNHCLFKKMQKRLEYPWLKLTMMPSNATPLLPLQLSLLLLHVLNRVAAVTSRSGDERSVRRHNSKFDYTHNRIQDTRVTIFGSTYHWYFCPLFTTYFLYTRRRSSTHSTQVQSRLCMLVYIVFCHRINMSVTLCACVCVCVSMSTTPPLSRKKKDAIKPEISHMVSCCNFNQAQILTS
jgi:hypothetical protein